MKLYVINGEAYTWDYIHNELGYTTTATESFQYMSARPETWGEYIGIGYGDRYGDVGDLEYYKYFVDGLTGWFADIDALALDGDAYPAQCDGGPTFTDGNTSSPSATYEFDGVSKYLIRDAVALGWKSESDLAAQGWTIEVDANYELLFFDVSTGKVSYGVETLNEMVFTATGYFTIEDGSDVVFVQPSQYPVVSPLSHNYDPNVSVADGVTLATDLPYYPTKLYIPVVVWHDESWNFYTDYIGWDIDGTSGSIVVTNNTGGTRIVLSVIAVLIDATDAEVAEVKNQLDEHFRAFKWTSGGTDYYYVEDGNEAWTDDLAAEGYEEVPAVVLPTVDANKWLCYYADGSTKSFSPDQTSDAYYWTGSGYSPLSYDSEKAYSIVEIRNSVNVFYGRVQLSIFNNSGAMAVRNVSDQTFQSTQSKYAVCSSNQATVVTVYDSSNIAYNAFKFTASGTDYYYVLDGTQTDWADDLASIGYSLYKTAWLESDRSVVTLSPEESHFLYNASGSDFYPETTVGSMSIIRMFASQSDTTGYAPTNISLISADGWGHVGIKNNSTSSITAQRITFTG